MHHRLHDQRGVCIQGFTYRAMGRPPGLLTGGEVGQTPRDTWNTTGYGPQADGTHPTGMLSDFLSAV